MLELADVIAVNKADGNHRRDAEGAAAELAAVLHLMAPVDGWSAPVLTCSAMEGERLDDVWAQVEAHRAHLERRGALAAKRRRQDVAWMWAAVEDQVLARFRARRGRPCQAAGAGRLRRADHAHPRRDGAARRRLTVRRCYAGSRPQQVTLPSGRTTRSRSTVAGSLTSPFHRHAPSHHVSGPSVVVEPSWRITSSR